MASSIVGLTGYAGAGKSTAAQYLVERHGFTRVSFAAPLKKMLRTLNPIVAKDGRTLSTLFEQYDGDENSIKLWFPEYRRLMQVLATECIRAEQEDFWVNAAMKHIGEGKYVFDDVRFPNEAAAITDLHPWGLWNVERPAVHAVNGHSSEQHVGRLGEKIWLFNANGQQESLHDQIDHAVDMVFHA